MGGLISADGKSLLEPVSFPKTVADASFVTRMGALSDGYIQVESIYDLDGRCISNCAYPGMTLSQVLKEIAIAEQESQNILAENQDECGDGTCSKDIEDEDTKDEEVIPTRNCTDFMESIPVTQKIPIGEPFPKLYPIASGFSPSRLDPVSKSYYAFHDGTDISAPNKASVYTVAGGTVEAVWTDNSCGNGIRIVHDDPRYRTGYCHLSQQLVKKGDHVSAGCVIGKVGSTGHSTGPHLHYVVWVMTNGKYTLVDAEKGYITPKEQRK